MKRHESCANCGLSYYIVNGWNSTCYCRIDGDEIEYPSKMGGREKCPCYMTNAEYRKERKKKAIENHVYPQKSEAKHED